MEDIKKEKGLLKGEGTIDRTFHSETKYSSKEVAEKAFERAVDKLFNVNAWSKLPGISSRFQVHTAAGEAKDSLELKCGEFIRISLPGPVPENWVVITDIRRDIHMAQFTVSPSIDPTREDERNTIRHFFKDGATSTFKVELLDLVLYGYEIGIGEGINNRGRKAGNRKLINTLVAEAGWIGFQKFQWKKITDYFVHQIEVC